MSHTAGVDDRQRSDEMPATRLLVLEQVLDEVDRMLDRCPISRSAAPGCLELHVREGDGRDAENLAALAIQVWLHTYATRGISSLISRYVLSEFTPAKFAARVSQVSSVVLVAEVGANLVGYAMVTSSRPCPAPATAKAELATLYVQEPFTGRRVGHALLTHAEQWARQRTNTQLWLTVNSKNSRAIQFYLKHGYTEIGLTHFELGNERHENLVLAGRDA